MFHVTIMTLKREGGGRGRWESRITKERKTRKQKRMRSEELGGCGELEREVGGGNPREEERGGFRGGPLPQGKRAPGEERERGKSV